MSISASPTASATTTVSPTAPASDLSAAAWGSAATQQAVATISDTSGKYSFDQQLAAYNSIVNLVTGSGTAGADRTAAVKAWENSSIYQQVSAAQDKYGSATVSPHGTSLADSQQQTINAFNNLSQNDQQIVVNQINNASVNGIYGNGKVAFASVDSYKANLQTRKDVLAAYESAVSSGAYKLGTDPSTISDPNLAMVIKLSQVQNQDNDAWTAQAQSAIAALNASTSATASRTPAVKVTLSAAAQAVLSPKTSTLSGSDVALQLLNDADATLTKSGSHSSSSKAPSTSPAHLQTKNSLQAYAEGSIFKTTA